jgi:GTPase
MLPVISIVGRPNVGKSTLFNCLTKSREALVADEPGLTRDRKYGQGQVDDKFFVVIDTGGIDESSTEIEGLMTAQAWQAAQESDVILFVVDGRAGLTPTDQNIALELRKLKKQIYLVVNKTDGIDPDVAASDFYALGFADIYAIAAAHGRGVTALIAEVLHSYDLQPELPSTVEGIKIAVVGQPNVGKSTLVNRILGEERVIVCDMPGTTRDSIFIPFTRREQNYTLIDTAGIRRRSKTKEKVEKFSIVKAIQAVQSANVVIFMIDARRNISEQDARLLGFVIESGTALVVAINKWDGLSDYDRERVRSELTRRLIFVDFAELFFISALHGTGVGDLFPAIHKAYRSAQKKLQTPQVNNILRKLVAAHEPPIVKNRRIKLRYAHAGGKNPPLIIIHGTQLKSLPLSYKKYLINGFRKALKLVGTPIRIEYKEGKNPYA